MKIADYGTIEEAFKRRKKPKKYTVHKTFTSSINFIVRTIGIFVIGI